MRYATALLLLALCAGCSSATQPEEVDCSNRGQKQFVQSLMSGIYLWADKAPDIDIEDFDTPADVMDAMAYRDVDRWSNIQTAVAHDQFFEQGQAVSFGYYSTFDDRGRLRVTFTNTGSSARNEGVTRGATIIALDDVPIEQVVTENLWGDVLGPNEEGTKVKHTVVMPDGEVRDVTLTKEVLRLDTVPVHEILDTPEGKVGYFMFTAFVATAEAPLREAFDEFRKANVVSVVVDLRYNGGGLVSIAGLLGSLIGGPDHEGDVLLRNTYNDEYSDLTSELLLTAEAEAVDVDRVVFIGSRGTASASEIVINGMRPLVDTELVGDTTFGKPVGADTWRNCDSVISPITFRSLNATGQGDYFWGITPQCFGIDDLDHALGDPLETRLALALHWLDGEPCYAASELPKDRPLPFDIGLAREQLQKVIDARPGGMF